MIPTISGESIAGLEYGKQIHKLRQTKGQLCTLFRIHGYTLSVFDTDDLNDTDPSTV